VKGLAALCKEKPADPVRWLATWLLKNNPAKPAVVRADGSALEIGKEPIPTILEPAARLRVEQESAEIVCGHRTGTVLCKNAILKADRWTPSATTTGTDPNRALFNLWDVPASPIWGCGQPTLDGVMAIIHKVLSGSGRTDRKVAWVNLRSEPMIFINRRPYYLKIRTAGTGELEDAKLSLRMTQLERMLKDEVLQNAAKHGGNLMMHDMEDDGVTPYAFWEHVNESTVHTPEELFQTIVQQGVAVAYRRVPVPNAMIWSDSDIDDYLTALGGLEAEDVRVIQTQRGEDKAAVGMVIATLMWRLLAGFEATIPVPPTLDDETPTDLLQRGEYKAVNALVKGDGSISDGMVMKLLLDDTIDKCSKMGNLRLMILSCKNESENMLFKADQRAAAREKAYNMLQRYIKLVMVGAFLVTSKASEVKETFSQWCAQYSAQMQVAAEMSELD